MVSLRTLLLTLLLSASATQVLAEELLKPYKLGSLSDPAAVQPALEAAGFQILSHSTPTFDSEVWVVTRPEMIALAAKSEHGGFGAVLRVSASDYRGTVTVAYTYPPFWAAAMRLKGDNAAEAALLESALGKGLAFGAEEGFRIKELQRYHYMMSMPYFDDPIRVAKHDNHRAAMAAVEAGFNAGKGETSLLYRLDIPGKDETIFGFRLGGDHDGSDSKLLGKLNTFTGLPWHTAYHPYQMLVTGKNVYILHGKFRIAVSFPDLTMVQFMKIVGAPGGIKDAARAVAK